MLSDCAIVGILKKGLSPSSQHVHTVVLFSFLPIDLYSNFVTKIEIVCETKFTGFSSTMNISNILRSTFFHFSNAPVNSEVYDDVLKNKLTRVIEIYLLTID